MATEKHTPHDELLDAVARSIVDNPEAHREIANRDRNLNRQFARLRRHLAEHGWSVDNAQAIENRVRRLGSRYNFLDHDFIRSNAHTPESVEMYLSHLEAQQLRNNAHFSCVIEVIDEIKAQILAETPRATSEELSAAYRPEVVNLIVEDRWARQSDVYIRQVKREKRTPWPPRLGRATAARLGRRVAELRREAARVS